MLQVRYKEVSLATPIATEKSSMKTFVLVIAEHENIPKPLFWYVFVFCNNKRFSLEV